MPRILSIVVAREGSKGLPSKCMLPIAGLPVVEHVIAWSQSLAHRGLNVTTAVSSDILALEGICEKHGAWFIPRSGELAGDHVRIEDVLYSVSRSLENGWDYLMLQYGNIPIRYTELATGPVEFLENNPAFDAVLTFQNVEKFNPAWMIDLCGDRLPPWKEKGFRRQDLKPFMVHDGHTVLTRFSYFIAFWPNREARRQGMMYESFGRTIKPWLHERLVIDVDSRRDYQLSKAVIESRIIID